MWDKSSFIWCMSLKIKFPQIKLLHAVCHNCIHAFHAQSQVDCCPRIHNKAKILIKTSLKERKTASLPFRNGSQGKEQWSTDVPWNVVSLLIKKRDGQCHFLSRSNLSKMVHSALWWWVFSWEVTSTLGCITDLVTITIQHVFHVLSPNHIAWHYLPMIMNYGYFCILHLNPVCK